MISKWISFRQWRCQWNLSRIPVQNVDGNGSPNQNCLWLHLIIWFTSQHLFEWNFENSLEFFLLKHRWFLEHWNSQKILCNIKQCFSFLLDEWIEKICKKIFFHGGFFFKSTLSVLRCTWTGRINLKIFLGYHINYLSIWPFMCHPWVPTRKASNLTFVCFQHHIFFAYFFNPLIK